MVYVNVTEVIMKTKFAVSRNSRESRSRSRSRSRRRNKLVEGIVGELM